MPKRRFSPPKSNVHLFTKKWSNFDPPAPHKFSTFKLMFRTRVEFAFLILFFLMDFCCHIPSLTTNNQQLAVPETRPFAPKWKSHRLPLPSFTTIFSVANKSLLPQRSLLQDLSDLRRKTADLLTKVSTCFVGFFLGGAVLNQGCRFVVLNMFGKKETDGGTYRSKYW